LNSHENPPIIGHKFNCIVQLTLMEPKINQQSRD